MSYLPSEVRQKYHKPGRDRDFKPNGDLKTELKWSGFLTPWEVSHGMKVVEDFETGEPREFHYWTVKDKFGARFSTKSRDMAEGIQMGILHVAKGEIAIRKGGCFLNLSEIRPFKASDFEDVSETIPPESAGHISEAQEERRGQEQVF